MLPNAKGISAPLRQQFRHAVDFSLKLNMAHADRKFRFSPLDPAAIDRQTRRIPVSFSSETPAMQRHNGLFPEVMRDAGIELGAPYVEILDHSPENVDLSILKNRGAFLDQHDEREHLGVVENVEIIDRVGRAVLRLGADEKAVKRFDQMADGIRPHISAGYKYTRFLGTEILPNGRTAYRFATRMLEISSVATPNDRSVGVARDDFFMRNNSLDELLRVALSGTRQTDDNPSLSEIVTSFITGPAGRVRALLEKNRSSGSGYSIPVSLLAEPRMTRDSTAGDFGSGGAMVATDLQSEAIKLVFNRSVVIGSGAQVIAGLRANYARAKILTAPTVQSLGETAPVTATDILAAQDDLKPCRISAQIIISKQLALQGGPLADRAIRKTMVDALTTALDSAFLFGQGRDQPLGIFETAGVQSFLFGGPASWTAIVGAEEALASCNMDLFRLGWATSPQSRARWKQIPKIVGSTTPMFIVGDNGKAGEYEVRGSTQLSGTNQAILAGWDTLETLFWGPPGGALEILVDPITKSSTGEIAFTGLLYANIHVPYPQAVTISADAANQ